MSGVARRSTITRCRERVLIEIGQKTSAAFWRRGDSRLPTRPSRRRSRLSRRQARGASDPFTSYYLASLHALRGEVDEAVALVRKPPSRLPALDPRARRPATRTSTRFGTRRPCGPGSRALAGAAAKRNRRDRA